MLYNYPKRFTVPVNYIYDMAKVFGKSEENKFRNDEDQTFKGTILQEFIDSNLITYNEALKYLDIIKIYMEIDNEYADLMTAQ